MRYPEYRHVNTDEADLRNCPDYCTSGSYLTKDYSQTCLDTYSRIDEDSAVQKGNWDLGEVGCSKLFDLSHTIQYGVRYLLYDEAGGGVEPTHECRYL